MNWKLTAGIALLGVGILTAVVLLVNRSQSGPAITVTLRIEVSPAERASFVEGQAKSARFKYLAGKRAGVKPSLAQQLSVRLVPASALLEAQINLPTREESRRYAEGFVETLQLLCGSQTKLALAEQTVR